MYGSNVISFFLMQIKSAEFVISSPNVTDCPESSIPEYAFIGRSKCGEVEFDNSFD